MRRSLGAAVLCLITAAPAAARELIIRSFDARISVQSDSSLEVTELIEVEFIGSWNGLYRTLPVEYSAPAGFNYTLLLEPKSVTDASGNALKYEVSRQGAYKKFKIWVPGAQDATKTVLLRYRVLDGLKFFEDHDELYWNVTGNEWDVPIHAASATIELPARVTGLRAAAYTGAYGSRAQDADVNAQGNEVTVHMRRPLAFREGLTVVVGWDKGFVHEPTSLDRALLFLRSNWLLGIPVFAFLAMFYLWWTRGRDPERDAVTVQYDPPDKLTPGEVGTLVDNEAAMRDITATLVDLAVKGYILIEQAQKDQLLGLLHDKDYIFHLKKPPEQWLQARPHEREMLGALFESGARDQVRLSELQNHFYTNLPAIRSRIFEALIADGYYLHRPDRVRQAYIAGGVLAGFAIFFLGTILSKSYGIEPTAGIIAAVATSVVVCGFGWFMPARTIQGARTYAKALGFEDFLGRVEADRIGRMETSPELFEKYLPFAMALHVEKKWVQRFANIAMQPPQWYVGPVYAPGYHPYFLVNDLDMMSSRAGAVLASAPRSSSGSSGFGGGGFSGGGFGGGGGGGF